MTDEVYDATVSVNVVRSLTITEDYYSAIGRFIARFSTFEVTLKWCLAMMVGMDGRHFNAVFSQMDVAKVIKALEVTIPKFFSEKEDKKRYKRLVKDAYAVNTDRVMIAHATWYETDEGVAARRALGQFLEETHLYTDIGELHILQDKLLKVHSDVGDLLIRVMDVKFPLETSGPL